MAEENQKEEVVKKAVKTSTIPKADSDFGKVVKAVGVAWLIENWLILKYITVEQYITKSDAFNAILAARLSEGGTRPQVTNALRLVNKEINGSVKIVKDYIAEKYRSSNPESYYAAFGIVRENDKYIFPVDQNNREDALQLMIKGITDNDMQDKIYGLDYWTEITDRFVKLVKQARELDGGISDKVGGKNVLKKELKKVLNSLIAVIKGNHPDTYKQELRKWGLQKEKY